MMIADADADADADDSNALVLASDAAAVGALVPAAGSPYRAGLLFLGYGWRVVGGRPPLPGANSRPLVS